MQHRGVLPTQRIEAAETVTEAQPTDGDGETRRVASGLFSGSPEADARGRAFDDSIDLEEDFVRPNGRG